MVLAAHVEKLEVYKMEQGGIFKPALLCRDYLNVAKFGLIQVRLPCEAYQIIQHEGNFHDLDEAPLLQEAANNSIFLIFCK